MSDADVDIHRCCRKCGCRLEADEGTSSKPYCADCWEDIQTRNEDAQAELAGRLLSEGEDPDAWRCRTCNAIYDGGQACAYCGDRNPLDDPEVEFEERRS